MKADDALSNPLCDASVWRRERCKDRKCWAYAVPGSDLLRAWHATRNNGEVLHG